MSDISGFKIQQETLVKYFGINEVVEIPDGITVIFDGAFQDNQIITSVIIPPSVRVIGKYAFQNCKNLKTVKFAESPNLNVILEYAFFGCSSLTDIDIPHGVRTIREHTFAFCDKLSSVHFSPLLYSIEAKAFDYCTGLTSISIPRFACHIYDGAFANCKNLSSAVFADSDGWVRVKSKGFSFPRRQKFADPAEAANIMKNGEGYRFYNYHNV